jgi:DNA repair protein RadC
MKIKEMNNNILPREKAKKHGIEFLSDIELISVILGSGVKGVNVFDLASNIIDEVGGLAEFDTYSMDELNRIKGIGKTKAIMLAAIIELNKRIYKQKIKKYVYLNNPGDIFEYFKLQFVNEKQEKFMVVLLDSKNALIDSRTIFVGTLTGALVHPREIIAYLSSYCAVSFIVLHNHPSNNVLPSEVDVDLTNKLMEIGILIGIPLLDHIIIGHDCFYSFQQNYNEG